MKSNCIWSSYLLPPWRQCIRLTSHSQPELWGFILRTDDSFFSVSVLLQEVDVIGLWGHPLSLFTYCCSYHPPFQLLASILQGVEPQRHTKIDVCTDSVLSHTQTYPLVKVQTTVHCLTGHVPGVFLFYSGNLGLPGISEANRIT